MVTLSFKLFVSFIILLIGLAGGFFPILVKVTNRTKKWLIYGESFAGGVFLGAGLIHLLPDAQATFTATFHVDYPVVFVICAASILFLRIIEEGVEKLIAPHMQHNCPFTWLSYLLVILLSVHSVLAGAALGVETTVAGFIVIFFAIIAHKGAAGFALGVSLRKTALPRASMVKLIAIFAVMTPIGILCGSAVSAFLHGTSGALATSIFNAIAAGTFMYIAAFHSHSVHMNGEDKLVGTTMKLSCFSLGLIVMAVVAIWL